MANEQQWRVDSAWTLLDQGNLVGVIKWVEQSLFVLDQKISPALKADLLNAKGNALRRMGKPTQALAIHQQVLNIRQFAYGMKGLPVGKSLHNIGNCELELGAYDLAKTNFKLALAIAQQQHDSLFMANIWGSMGSLYYESGQLNRAFQYYYHAWQYQQKKLFPKHPALFNNLSNLARIALDQNNTALAIQFINALEQLHDAPLALPVALRLKAMYHRQKGNISLSIQLLRKAISIWENLRLHHSPEWYYCQLDLSLSFRQKGEYQIAIGALQRALYSTQNTKELIPIKLAIHNNLAELLHLQDKDSLAIFHLEQALALSSIQQEKNINPIYINLAALYLQIGELEISSTYLNLAKKNDTDVETLAIIHLLTGQIVEKNTHHLEKSLTEYVAAYNILRRHQTKYPELFAYSILHIARYFEVDRQFAAAEAYLAQGLKVLHSKEALQLELYPTVALQLLSLQAQLALDIAHANPIPYNWSKAEAMHQKAISYLENYQNNFEDPYSILFANAGYRSLFTGLVEVLFEQGNRDKQYYEKAFDCVEGSKFLLLQQMLKQSQAKKYAHISDQYLYKEAELQSRIRGFVNKQQNSKNPKLVLKYAALRVEAEEELRILLQTIEVKFPLYYQLKHANKRVNLKEIQKHLPRDQTLVSYFLGNEQVYIFAITNHEFKAEVVHLPSDFRVSVKNWYHLIQNPSSEESKIQLISSIGFQLYKILIRPIESNLRQRIAIIPDGILHYVPFETLLYRYPQKDIPIRQFPFLIKKHAFSYTNLTTLTSSSTPKGYKSKGYLLAMAPNFDLRTQGLNNLTYAQEEVKLVAKKIRSSKKIYQGASATEQQFKLFAPHARIIHLATHGMFDDLHPELSGLVFSDFKQTAVNPGKLTTAEVYALTLEADLIFLSACQTNVGELYAGEGMLTLSRAFYYAGAKSIIATLWSVPDNQTSYIAIQFYGYLHKGIPKDVALQKAKLDFFQRARTIQGHPAFWGALTVSGDSSPIYHHMEQNFWLWVCGISIALALRYFIFYNIIMKRPKRFLANGLRNGG